MRSDIMKKGLERTPYRSLFRAAGLKTRDFSKPFIGVCNSYVSIVPGHAHLQKVGRIICNGIRKAGGTHGACIGHVSPEAASGGLIALVRNGDIIEIDIPARTVNLKVSKAEIARRRKNWKPVQKEIKSSWLRKYPRLATSADTGGVLKAD